MRLKFLFFPIILVVSATIFAAYVWPEIENVKTLNTDLLASKDTLQAVKDRQAALEAMGQQINSDASTQSLIMSYLPVKKVEEQIINNANFLATDAGVSLANMSVKDVVDPTLAAAPVAAPAPSSAIIPSTLGNPAELSGAQPANNVQFSEATIQVTGKYDQLRSFFSQLQRMSILNEVKSVKVSKAQSSSDTKTADPSILQADLVIDYGYVPSMHFSNQQIANAKVVFDSKTIGDLRNYTTQKVPSIDTGSLGTANMFLP